MNKQKALIVLLRATRNLEGLAAMIDKDTPISVIVNTYNRAKYLENTLLGIQGLLYSKLEVIVVNGPSNDGTDRVLDRWNDSIKVASAQTLIFPCHAISESV